MMTLIPKNSGDKFWDIINLLHKAGLCGVALVIFWLTANHAFNRHDLIAVIIASTAWTVFMIVIFTIGTIIQVMRERRRNGR